MITVIYRVSVTMPEDVHQWAEANPQEYDRLVAAAIKGNVTAGCDTYGPGRNETAEFHDEDDAERAESKLVHEVIPEVRQRNADRLRASMKKYPNDVSSEEMDTLTILESKGY